MTDQTTQAPAEEIGGSVSSIDQLAYLVGGWFHDCHKELDHAYNAPDGTPVTVTFEKDGQSEEIVLTGDMLKGFKAGLIVAMSTFGQLPFTRAEDVQAEAIDDSRQIAEQLSGHDGDDAAAKD